MSCVTVNKSSGGSAPRLALARSFEPLELPGTLQGEHEEPVLADMCRIIEQVVGPVELSRVVRAGVPAAVHPNQNGYRSCGFIARGTNRRYGNDLPANRPCEAAMLAGFEKCHGPRRGRRSEQST